ncbi:MAG: M13 family metallopeptidase [Acidobacteriota bacterium]|nr:M13 family metallopeptidase [Acidobacteriota bacterium]
MKLTVALPGRIAVAACLPFAAALLFAAPPGHHVAGPTVNPSYMDTTVVPGNNFYKYACGDWEKNAKIPADRVEVSPGEPLYNEHQKRLDTLILDAAKDNPAAGTAARKVVDLYNSYMNESAVEAQGVKPLEPHLRSIAEIHNRKQLARALGLTLRADEDALNMTNFHSMNLFGLWVAPGFSDSAHYTAYLMQGGIAMPDREYYLSDADAMKKIRAKYVQHVEKMFTLAGFDHVAQRAARVIALEHAIAQVQWSLADNNDIHKANNPWSMKDFAKKAPGLDWAAYFHAAGLERQKQFIVWQPSAVIGESALVASQPVDTWKDWLAFHVIESYGSVLPKPFAEEEFDFYGKELGGASEQSPRWQRAVGFVSGYLGDDLGQLYVKRYFPPEVKAQVEAMVTNLIAVYRKRIEALTWMTPSTKKEAVAKLDSLYVGVGYGETWHDYSNYEVKPDDLFGNVWRGRLAKYERNRALLGKVVDKKEWQMAPQTINAVNLPLQNALNFPAAILEPPYFDPKAPAAANYGSIGAVIGHEISHTFDSEGSAFDAQGRVRNWWTPEDFAHFKAETAKLVAQYDAYKVFPDLSLNGRQTLAENLADVAGLDAALDAYHQSLEGKPAPQMDGFTGDQQFFIAFAQSWAVKMRDAALRDEVLTDTHSPGPWRALTVRNVNAWYGAFDVKPDEKLYLAPKDRVQIW